MRLACETAYIPMKGPHTEARSYTPPGPPPKYTLIVRK